MPYDAEPVLIARSHPHRKSWDWLCRAPSARPQTRRSSESVLEDKVQHSPTTPPPTRAVSRCSSLKRNKG